MFTSQDDNAEQVYSAYIIYWTKARNYRFISAFFTKLLKDMYPMSAHSAERYHSFLPSALQKSQNVEDIFQMSCISHINVACRLLFLNVRVPSFGLFTFLHGSWRSKTPYVDIQRKASSPFYWYAFAILKFIFSSMNCFPAFFQYFRKRPLLAINILKRTAGRWDAACLRWITTKSHRTTLRNRKLFCM